MDYGKEAWSRTDGLPISTYGFCAQEYKDDVHACNIYAYSAMSTPDPFAAWLQERLRALSIDHRELSARVGLNRSSVSRWVSGRSRPSPGSLRLLAEALGETVAVLYRLADYPADLGELAQLSPDELELVVTYRKLSPEQKRMLLAAARAGP